jgi:hypothetical protein
MSAYEFGSPALKNKAVPSRDAGYSGTPLAAKLGLEDGQAVAFIALPKALGRLAEVKSFASVSLAPNISDLRLPPRSVDLVHGFFVDEAAMRKALPQFRDAIREAGSIWISWPKKSAKVPSDLSDEVVRGAALAAGLVDIKECAVDATWSGLKLVVPRDKRARHSS